MIDLGYTRFGDEILRPETCMQCSFNCNKERTFKCSETKRKGGILRGRTCRHFNLSEEDKYNKLRYQTESEWYYRGYSVMDNSTPVVINDMELYSIEDVFCRLDYIPPQDDGFCTITISDDLRLATVTLTHKIKFKYDNCFKLLNGYYVYICSIGSDSTLRDIVNNIIISAGESYFFSFIHKGFCTTLWDECMNWYDCLVTNKCSCSLEEYIQSIGG